MVETLLEENIAEMLQGGAGNAAVDRTPSEWPSLRWHLSS